MSFALELGCCAFSGAVGEVESLTLYLALIERSKYCSCNSSYCGDYEVDRSWRHLGLRDETHRLHGISG